MNIRYPIYEGVYRILTFYFIEFIDKTGSPGNTPIKEKPFFHTS